MQNVHIICGANGTAKGGRGGNCGTMGMPICMPMRGGCAIGIPGIMGGLAIAAMP